MPFRAVVFGIWLAVVAALTGIVGGLAGQALATAPRCTGSAPSSSLFVSGNYYSPQP